MNLAATRHALAIGILLVTTACGNGNDTASTAPARATSDAGSGLAGMLALPERYSKNLTRAFATASEGRSPTMACTSVIAQAAGNPLPGGTMPEPAGVRAFELCYIDVGARYIDALLAQITAGEPKDELCAKIASYAVIARTSFGSFAGNVRLDVATLDQRLLDRVQARMTAACPEQVGSLNGYR